MDGISGGRVGSILQASTARIFPIISIALHTFSTRTFDQCMIVVFASVSSYFSTVQQDIRSEKRRLLAVILRMALHMPLPSDDLGLPLPLQHLFLPITTKCHLALVENPPFPPPPHNPSPPSSTCFIQGRGSSEWIAFRRPSQWLFTRPSFNPVSCPFLKRRQVSARR